MIALLSGTAARTALALLLLQAGPYASAALATAADPPVPPAAEESVAARLARLFDEGRDEEIVRIGEEHLKNNPADVDVRLAVSRALSRAAAMAGEDDKVLRQAFLTRAFDHLRMARLGHPGRLEVRVGICDILYHLDRHSTLLVEIHELLAERPSDEQALGHMGFYGEQYLASGRVGRAVDVFGVIAKMAPEDGPAASNHGTALILAGRLDEGIAELTRAVRLDPDDADAAHNLGQARLHRGDLPGALEAFRRSRDARPESGRFILDLAVVTAVTDPDGAVPLFEKAGEILNVHEPQAILVNNLRIGMTRPELTAKDLQRLARELDESGYPIYALAAADKALRADPSLVPTLLLRARINERRRFFGRSLDDYRRAGEVIADDPQGRKSFGHDVTAGVARGLLETGRPQEALDLLRKEGPSDRFPFETADALVKIGDVMGAMTVLETVAMKGNDPSASEAARRRMNEIATGKR